MSKAVLFEEILEGAGHLFCGVGRNDDILVLLRRSFNLRVLFGSIFPCCLYKFFQEGKPILEVFPGFEGISESHVVPGQSSAL